MFFFFKESNLRKLHISSPWLTNTSIPEDQTQLLQQWVGPSWPSDRVGASPLVLRPHPRLKPQPRLRDALAPCLPHPRLPLRYHCPWTPNSELCKHLGAGHAPLTSGLPSPLHYSRRMRSRGRSPHPRPPLNKCLLHTNQEHPPFTGGLTQAGHSLALAPWMCPVPLWLKTTVVLIKDGGLTKNYVFNFFDLSHRT